MLREIGEGKAVVARVRDGRGAGAGGAETEAAEVRMFVAAGRRMPVDAREPAGPFESGRRPDMRAQPRGAANGR
jgi:hypothetical protein